VHWLEWNVGQADSTFGKNGKGNMEYLAPCPPKSETPHEYLITVYALSACPELRAGADLDAFHAAIDGLVIGTDTTNMYYCTGCPDTEYEPRA
jgi:phosphatidylethanolamine-binding protein (PEBP) family uncharacterized protein